MEKNKPWDIMKQQGFKGPHKVDERFFNAPKLYYDTSAHGFDCVSNRESFDRMRVGRIEEGRRYMGNNCWQHVNVEESCLNEWNDPSHDSGRLRDPIS